MKSQISQLLNLSLVPDSASLKQVTTKLTDLSKQQGYCMMNMQIANDQSQPTPIRQAALVQFKNTARKYWSATEYEISAQQKTAIINALLPAFIQAAGNYSLLKLYKQIVCIIIGHVYKQWMPVDILCSALSTGQNKVAILHFIIAIQTNFQISIHQEERDFYYEFLKKMLPSLFTFVQNNNSEEIIYLLMKIIWKIVHYEVSAEIRRLLCNWMDLILSVAGASHQQLQSKIQQFQDKGTMEFFYFHAKKWATRILYRFIYKHASTSGGILCSEQVKQLNKQFSKYWYDTFGQRVVETITQQFLVPSINKTRYFQIKCLTGLINNHPQVMRQYAQSFQYQILPKYLQLKPEDEQIANNDPLEFINQEDDYSVNYTYLKKVAMEAWVAFTNIGAKRKKKGKNQQIGALFNENMKYLREKLEGSNPLQKEMAMYLICQLRSMIQNSEQIKSILPNLISIYVVPQFTSDIMFLRARSMQIFEEYGDLTYDKSILKKIVEGIYFCLTQDNYPLVRLKAASAFHVLLHHSEAREEVKPLFKQILQIYLLLLEKYDSQTLVASLSGIVEHFSIEVGPYACDLMRYLGKHFVKLFTKDKEKSKDPDYDGETELAASGILNTMKTLLQSPIDKENIAKMQVDIMDVCDYVFCSNDIDYIDDIIQVLRAYTHRVSAITQRLLFYYVILIYYIVGIDEKYWPQINSLNIPQINKKGLETVRVSCNVESLSEVMLVLRNYISLDVSVLLKLNDPFGMNLLELLFKMVEQIYKKGPSEFEGEVEMNNCTILMVYLLENYHRKWDEQIIAHMWMVAQYNLTKAKSKVLKAINAQLLCVFLWNCPSKTIALAQSNNLLDSMILCILQSESRLKMEHERQRVILGLSELLNQANKPKELLIHLPNLMKMLVKLVEKNCEARLNDDADDHYQTDSEEEEEDELLNIDYNEDEPQDIWDEDFENNYSSKLDEIDQIKHFKTCMQKLQNEDNQFYLQLINTLPVDQLTHLDAQINKAIALAQS